MDVLEIRFQLGILQARASCYQLEDHFVCITLLKLLSHLFCTEHPGANILFPFRPEMTNLTFLYSHLKIVLPPAP